MNSEYLNLNLNLNLASKERNQKHITGLILENTFLSISSMVDALFSPLVVRYFPRTHGCLLPFLKNIVKPVVLQIGWFSSDSITKIALPMLFLSGLQDELVPASHMKQLYDNAAQSVSKRMVTFPSGKHNDLPSQEGYFDRVAEFLRQAPQMTRGTGRTLGSGSGVAVSDDNGSSVV